MVQPVTFCLKLISVTSFYRSHRRRKNAQYPSHFSSSHLMLQLTPYPTTRGVWGPFSAIYISHSSLFYIVRPHKGTSIGESRRKPAEAGMSNVHNGLCNGWFMCARYET